jgi:CheY-like chemotaxis protein/DNA-directed RNA polymerase specialized sigma24 family protein
MSAAPAKAIVDCMPFLRRYARALTGSQERGDRYVRLCLETLVAEPGRIASDADARLQVYAIFHDVYRLVGASVPEQEDHDEGIDAKLAQQIEALPDTDRQVLLLVYLEDFSLDDVAYILGLNEAEVMERLDAARSRIWRRAGADVLIIEDDPIIAMSNAELVREMGHNVVGMAARKDEAIAIALKTSPDLVIADIQLQGGDDGVEAVQDILGSMAVPVIFVTGHPERLLTGEQPEPAFVITKPFKQETLRTAIGQALSFQPTPAATT